MGTLRSLIVCALQAVQYNLPAASAPSNVIVCRHNYWKRPLHNNVVVKIVTPVWHCCNCCSCIVCIQLCQSKPDSCQVCVTPSVRTPYSRLDFESSGNAARRQHSQCGVAVAAHSFSPDCLRHVGQCYRPNAHTSSTTCTPLQICYMFSSLQRSLSDCVCHCMQCQIP